MRALLDSVIANVTRLAGSEAGLVSIWDPGRGRLRATSSYGLAPSDEERLQQALDAVLPALLEEGRDVAELEGVFPPPTGEKILALPLRSHGRTVGLLCLFLPPDQSALRDDGRVVDVLSDHVDVILRNAQLLQGIIEEKRWLEAIVNSTGEGLLILDAEGRILGANPAFYRMTGLTPERIGGRTLTDVFNIPPTPPDEPLVELTIRPAGRRVFEANRAIIRGDNDEPIGGVVSLRDVTARREAEELQSTFFSVISHELKTPIAVIRGYADLIADSSDEADPEQLRRQARVIRDESERLARMVENLLEATRIQSGALELSPEPVALGPLIARLVRRMRRGERRTTHSLPRPRRRTACAGGRATNRGSAHELDRQRDQILAARRKDHRLNRRDRRGGHRARLGRGGGRPGVGARAHLRALFAAQLARCPPSKGCRSRAVHLQSDCGGARRANLGRGIASRRRNFRL